jgi:hypothetical protein
MKRKHTPLCSTCHGDCCVNKRGNVVEHRSALALHSCRDCLDGFAPALAEHTADTERAAVVAWLRWVAGDTREWSEVADVYDTIADNIERGEHNRKEEGS